MIHRYSSLESCVNLHTVYGSCLYLYQKGVSLFEVWISVVRDAHISVFQVMFLCHTMSPCIFSIALVYHNISEKAKEAQCSVRPLPLQAELAQKISQQLPKG